MNKKIILVFVIILIIFGIVYFEKMKPKAPDETNIGKNEAEIKEGKFLKAPELVGISGYLNTEEGLKISDLKGKVVLIDFWTYTCINCIRTLPFLVEWDEKYRDDGLVIIGVHTPEFPFEKEYANVKMAMEKYGIKYPVVQDNDYATWNAYKNRYWPHKYLIDAEGFIRYDHIGEGAYDETEKKIQELLGEIGKDVSEGTTEIEDKTPRVRQTPELYAGYEFALPRGQNLGNDGGMKPDEIVDYVLPDRIEKDAIYLEGKWKSNKNDLKAEEEGASIALEFTASAVNIVADSSGDALEMEVFIDDKYVRQAQAGDDVEFDGEKAFVVVDEPRLYNVVRGEYGNYKLKLKTNSEYFSFNAFTFG